MIFVSVTRLHLRSWRYLPGFIWYATRSASQARAAVGNLKVALNRDVHAAYWTISLWSDESAMRHVMMTGPHKRAMPHLLEWCDEAAIVHWLQESHEIPPWNEASRRLQNEGRASKLKHPSDAHRNFRIPSPV